MWALLVGWLSLNLAQGTKTGQVTRQLAPDQELYFERLGPMALHTGEWRIILHLHVQDLLQQPETLIFDDLCTTRVYQMLQWCRTHANVDLLKIQQRAIAEGAARLRKAAEDLEPERTRPQTSGHLLLRREAPPLGFIGDLSRNLLGTLTKEDTQALEKHVTMLQNNQNTLVKLQNQRAHVVEFALKTFGAWNTAQQELFHNQVQQVQQNLESLNRSQMGFTQDIDLLALQQHTLLELGERRRTQEELLTILWGVQNGQTHPHLLNQIPWEAVWADIDSLPSPWKLPLLAQHRTPGSMGRLAKTQGSYIGERIYFTIKIPLVEGIAYDLYQVHTFTPPPHEESPSVLALSKDRSSYTVLRNRDLEGCYPHSGGRICPPRWPLRNPQRATGEEKRILEALEPSEAATEQWEGAETTFDYWNYLPQEGAWLHSLGQPRKILIACFNHDTELLRIAGKGLLYLDKGCSAHTPEGILHTQGKLPPPLSEEENRAQEKQVRRTQNTPINQKQAINHLPRHIFYLGGGGSLGGIIIILIIVICRRQRNRAITPPTPREERGGNTPRTPEMGSLSTLGRRDQPRSQNQLTDLPAQAAEV